MRFLIRTLVILVALVAIAVVALPYLLPQGWVKQQIARQLEGATGREVTIAGEARLQVLPTLAARLGEIEIANAPGFEEPHLLRAEAVAAELALMPLLERRVEVQSFTLSGLDLRLEIDGNGAPNWELAPAQDTGVPAPAETTAEAEAPSDAGTTSGVPLLMVDSFRIENGAVRFADARSGMARTLDAIDGTIALPGLDQPTQLDLDARLDGRPLTLGLEIASPAALLAGTSADVALSVSADGLGLGFAGDVTGGSAPAVDGTVQLNVVDAGPTIGWLAANPVELPLDAIRVETSLQATAERVALDDLRFETDAASGSGALVADLGDERPAVRGSLALGVVDLGVFTAPQPPAAGDADTGSSAEPASGEGWPEDPIAMPPLPVDVDVMLTMEGLEAPPLTFGPGVLNVSGTGGGLDVAIEQLSLYDGNASGTVQLRPTAGGLGLEQDVELVNIQTGPLLRDLTGSGLLDGRARVGIAASSQGGSVKALVGNLDGQGQVAVDSAILEGLAGSPELEALRALFGIGGEPGGAIRSANLSAGFQIADGIVTNDDLEASTTALRVDGRGSIDLPNRQVPGYWLTPALSDPLGLTDTLRGLMVPVKIQGPFDNLQVRPAPEAMVDQPREVLDRAQDQVREGDLEGAAETIINEGVGGILRGLGVRP